MKIKLLKKIKKDWSIVHYVDPDLNNGTLIYRAKYKGKWIDYAWIEDKGQEEYRTLILAIAHGIKFDGPCASYFEWRALLNGARQNRLNRRKGGTPRERAFKLAKTIWP